jgi:hypothetical protein
MWLEGMVRMAVQRPVLIVIRLGGVTEWETRLAKRVLIRAVAVAGGFALLRTQELHSRISTINTLLCTPLLGRPHIPPSCSFALSFDFFLEHFNPIHHHGTRAEEPAILRERRKSPVFPPRMALRSQSPRQPTDRSNGQEEPVGVQDSLQRVEGDVSYCFIGRDCLRCRHVLVLSGCPGRLGPIVVLAILWTAVSSLAATRRRPIRSRMVHNCAQPPEFAIAPLY